MPFPFFTDKEGTTVLNSTHTRKSRRVFDDTTKPDIVYAPTVVTHQNIAEHTKSKLVKHGWGTLSGTSTKFRQVGSYGRTCYEINERSSTAREYWKLNKYTNVYELDGCYYPPLPHYHAVGDIWTGSGMCSSDQNLINQAETEALLKLQDGKAQLGAALAEMRSTFNQVAGAASTLFRAFNSAKRGRWRQVPRDLGMSPRDVLTGKFAANNLLAYKFGWLPLMQDIHDGIKFLSEDLPPAMLLRAERQIHDRGRAFWVGSSSLSKARGYANRWHGCTLFAKASATWIRKAALGGLVNPLEVAWEVMPYSFIIDWGIPIGNVLQGLTATVGLDFVGGYRSLRFEADVDVTFGPPEATTNISYSGDYGGYTVKAYGYRRTELYAFPRPNLYVRSPFSTGRALTALALYRQLYR